MLITVAVAAFPVVVALAASYDLLTMTIPNSLSAALIVSFALLTALLMPGWMVVGWHVGVGLATLVVTFVLFAFRVLGGGDAKLAAAIALWIGPAAMPEFLVYAAFAGGALSIAILIFRSRPLPLFALRHDWITRLHKPKGEIPYGLALAAGALMAYPETRWFAAFPI
jgi:prepilin peptidase CpaA